MSSLVEKLVYDAIEEYERLATENKNLAEALRTEWATLNRPVDPSVDQPVDADGWIKWDGGVCPVDPAVLVEVKYLYGDVDDRQLPADQWAWYHDGEDDDIIAYRIVS